MCRLLVDEDCQAPEQNYPSNVHTAGKSAASSVVVPRTRNLALELASGCLYLL
jgi:hypothetical protein